MNIQSPPFTETTSTSTWWAIALRGALAVAFGAIALSLPANTAQTIVLVFVVFAVADGVAALVASARRGRRGERWSWFFFEGIASIAAGVIAFSFPAATFFMLVLIVAIRAIVLGLFDVLGAFAGKGVDSRWLLALGGVLEIVLGAMLLARPLVGGVAILWTIGIYAIVTGIMTFAFGIHVRGLQKHEGTGAGDVHLGGHPATT